VFRERVSTSTECKYTRTIYYSFTVDLIRFHSRLSPSPLVPGAFINARDYIVLAYGGATTATVRKRTRPSTRSVQLKTNAQQTASGTENNNTANTTVSRSRYALVADIVAPRRSEYSIRFTTVYIYIKANLSVPDVSNEIFGRICSACRRIR